MKKQIKLTFSNVLFVLSTFIFSLLLSKVSLAQASYEVMCRNKAKETAAEIYKGCMTENRQTEIEQIRKDYKDKLAKLKNHYDNKLKKLSGDAGSGETSVGAEAQVQAETKATTTTSKKSKQRSSGARMPVKKQGASQAYSTQVIDLSQPVESQNGSNRELSAALESEKKASSENNEIEVVELPTQE